jgi:hypothetical protein
MTDFSDVPPLTPPGFDPGPFPPITPAGIANAVLLLQLTQLRMGLGLDPDGSATTSDFLAILGGYRQLGRVVCAPGMPWDPSAEAAIALVRRKVRAAEPILARLARPDRKA